MIRGWPDPVNPLVQCLDPFKYSGIGTVVFEVTFAGFNLFGLLKIINLFFNNLNRE